MAIPAPTDILLNLQCPGCRGRLALRPSTSQPTFGCPEGHVVTLSVLRSLAAPQQIDRRLETLIHGWERRHSLLGRIAEDAQKRGYDLLAEETLEQMRSLEERARDLSRHVRPSFATSPPRWRDVAMGGELPT